MQAVIKINWVIILLTGLVLSACATTKPVGEWRSDSFSGSVDDILIIGVTSRTTRRRLFEDQFAAGLATYNKKAVASYKLLESSLYLTRDVIERAIKGQDIGAVLITRLVGIKEKEVFREPANYDYHRGYFGYYDHAWQKTNTGYYSEYKVFTLETNLYDVASGELVWSMQSETMDVSQPREIIKEQIELSINSLVRQGLI